MIFFSHKCGQLGNRLFCFAHLIAYAEANNLKIINLSFDEYAQFFQATSQDVFCGYPARATVIKNGRVRTFLFLINKIVLKLLRTTKLINSSIHAIITADLPEYQFNEDRYFDLGLVPNTILQKKSLIFLFGRFFRDYKNLEKHQHTIRSYFRPVNKIEVNVKLLIEKGKIGCDILVGVHIRRGDYEQFSNGKYFYSQAQYGIKMKELQDSMPDKKIMFIVCSNERIEPQHFSEVHFLNGTGHFVEDLYTLSNCDFIMGPPSTYTLWASFYGNRPLYQIVDLKQSISLDHFRILPPKILYNFTFN
jgi:hypothetical protein